MLMAIQEAVGYTDEVTRKGSGKEGGEFGVGGYDGFSFAVDTDFIRAPVLILSMRDQDVGLIGP